MSEMTLAQWLKANGHQDVKPGDPCWVVRRVNSGSKVYEGEIVSIGRRYIKTSVARDVGFYVEDDDRNFLQENTSAGWSARLYLSKPALDDMLEREELSLRFRRNYDAWLQGVSTTQLKAAVMILENGIPDETLRRAIGMFQVHTGP